MKRQKISRRIGRRTRLSLLLGVLVAAALVLPSLADARPRRVVVKHYPHRTVVVVHKSVPKPKPLKKVWVRGRWALTPLGWRVWVAGHWKLVR
jgi:hypothetical protein